MSDLEDQGKASETAEGPFSPKEALEEFTKNAPPKYGRKLTLSEKCGLAIALRSVPQLAVRKAFNLSRATVSMLAHALEPGRPHYQEIREQFVLLGEDAFREQYYTRELHFRLKRVKLRIIDENFPDLPGSETDYAPRTFGPDPRAVKYQGKFTMEDGSRWEVGKPEIEPRGWYFRSEDHDPDIWHGQAKHSPRRRP